VKTQKYFLVHTAALSVAVALSFPSYAQEQFSLDGKPSVLFDGESNVSTSGTIDGIKYVVINGHAVAQGDMVIGKVFADDVVIPAFRTTRGLGQSRLVDRWPDGIVPFQFSDNITTVSKQRSLDAIQHWTERTGIMFVERTAANAAQYSDYVNFEPSAGCASWVGRVGRDQAIWVSDNCTTGSIIHEIGHAIGLFHEHTRPDRDNFITVNWDNIVNGKSFNFDVLNAGVDQLGPYDYGSIMHYGEFFFSDNGRMTIQAPDGVEVGQRNALSVGDADAVDTMYQTDLSLATNVTNTENGVEVNLAVSNEGSMGANTLELVARMGDSADWLSISTESGWDCQEFDIELRCTRETLAGETQSRFTVLVDPKGATEADLGVRVVSNTRDTDTSNNSVNFDDPKGELPPAPQEEPATELDENSTTGSSSEGKTDGGTTPDIGGAQSGGSSGGGAALWIAFFAWLSQRTRNKQEAA